MQKQPKLWRTEPTATTWVARGPDGEMQIVNVVDMTDQHLFRWIRYFRKKWRDAGFSGTDAVLDAIIKDEMVTAPAIYAEAVKRGVEMPTTTPDQPPRAAVETPTGTRRITLDDE